ncbi:MAG: SpoIID/LytB domain-containing protein [Gemmatimonadaceae bacterium]
MRWRVALLGAAAVLACTPRVRDGGEGAIRAARGVPPVRVALATGLGTVPLAASGGWTLTDARGDVLVRARAGERWEVQRRGSELRAIRDIGTATAWRAGPLTQRPERGGAVRHAGKSYRGALRIVTTESGLAAVNVVPLEDYLRGVVPLELGPRPRAERAAVEAQAIAARSYTVIRMAARGARAAPFDLGATVADQVYGGRDAEDPVADAAVAGTAGRVLLYGGRVVTAPFHSTCGGETAAAQEVWRSDGEPHLRRVSDRIPGRDRYYCDIAPRFAWTRELSGATLNAVVARYLAAFVTVPTGGPGEVDAVSVVGRTPSGRVDQLRIRAVRGTFAVRGNDARSVLRSDAGEPLPSAYFEVRAVPASGGGIGRLVIRGNGFGHGVGMCQWGAIGRARAGQSARAILRTYYPGTTIGPIPSGSFTQ